MDNKWSQSQRNWYAILAIVILLGSGWIFVSRVPARTTTDGGPPPSPREGFSAPDFTLDRMNSGSLVFSELRGQVVMINFWASWCPPCREEMPAIQRVYEEFKDQGLVVVGINTTFQDHERDAMAFVEEFGLTFPIVMDWDGSVSDRYQLRGLPSTYFVDRQGVIGSVIVGGPMSEALIRSTVENLITKSP